MIEYFLHADLLVPQDKQREFEGVARKFLVGGGKGKEAFRRLVPDFDNELVMSLKTRSFEYTGPAAIQLEGSARQDSRLPIQVIKYINVWKVRDLRDLDIASVMLRSADDSLYSTLNSLVIREVQNYIIRVRWLSAIASGAPEGEVLEVRRHFLPGAMGRYLAAAGALFPQLEALGWKSRGYFQTVTGPLNTIIEYWEQLNEPKAGAHESLGQKKAAAAVGIPLTKAFEIALDSMKPLRPAFGQEQSVQTLPLVSSGFLQPAQAAE